MQCLVLLDTIPLIAESLEVTDIEQTHTAY